MSDRTANAEPRNLRRLLYNIFLDSNMGPFHKGKNTYSYAVQKGAVSSPIFLTPVWHGDLDHSDFQNDRG